MKKKLCIHQIPREQVIIFAMNTNDYNHEAGKPGDEYWMEISFLDIINQLVNNGLPFGTSPV